MKIAHLLMLSVVLTPAAACVWFALRGLFSEAQKPTDEQYNPFTRSEP